MNIGCEKKESLPLHWYKSLSKSICSEGELKLDLHIREQCAGAIFGVPDSLLTDLWYC